MTSDAGSSRRRRSATSPAAPACPRRRCRAPSTTRATSVLTRSPGCRRAAEELGFRPNQFARLLRTRGTASMIGVVTASVGDPFWTGVLQGVEAVIGGGDRFILSASTRDRSDREAEIVMAMVERRVMALLVVPTAVDQSYLAAIVAAGTPVVCIDRPAVGADIDSVVADDFGGVRRGMRLLTERGHRRIAFLGTRLGVHDGQAARRLPPGARRCRHRRRRSSRPRGDRRGGARRTGRRRAARPRRSADRGVRRQRQHRSRVARRGCAVTAGHRRSSRSATPTRPASTTRRSPSSTTTRSSSAGAAPSWRCSASTASTARRDW